MSNETDKTAPPRAPVAAVPTATGVDRVLAVAALAHGGADVAESSADAAADPLIAYRARYRDAAYYSAGREWTDYAPAYRYGQAAFAARGLGARRFKDVEPALARDWLEVRGESRLGWAEARGAAMDAWRGCSDAQPGGIGRRGH
ncbi:MAG: hypothetical protein ACREO8_00325 [Luteimonas sp.]